MSDSLSDIREIVVEEVFPHAPATIWRTLATGELMGRWLMEPAGFAPLVGTRFMMRTRPAGAWDGTIRCEVLAVVPNERLSYAWKGGHADNIGYGAPLDTVVTWTLAPVDGGTRLRLVHAGFVLPRNASALELMGKGWRTVLPRIGAISGGEAA